MRRQDNDGEMMDSGRAGREMDLNIALSHVDGDLQFLAELAELFLQDYPRLLEELRHSVLSEDYSNLERAAHTLKGRLAFFGLNTLRDKLFGLEMMGRERNSANIGPVLADIEFAVARILPEFALLVREQAR